MTQMKIHEQIESLVKSVECLPLALIHPQARHLTIDATVDYLAPGPYADADTVTGVSQEDEAQEVSTAGSPDAVEMQEDVAPAQKAPLDDIPLTNHGDMPCEVPEIDPLVPGLLCPTKPERRKDSLPEPRLPKGKNEPRVSPLVRPLQSRVSAMDCRCDPLVFGSRRLFPWLEAAMLPTGPGPPRTRRAHGYQKMISDLCFGLELKKEGAAYPSGDNRKIALIHTSTLQ